MAHCGSKILLKIPSVPELSGRWRHLDDVIQKWWQIADSLRIMIAWLKSCIGFSISPSSVFVHVAVPSIILYKRPAFGLAKAHFLPSLLMMKTIGLLIFVLVYTSEAFSFGRNHRFLSTFGGIKRARERYDSYEKFNPDQFEKGSPEFNLAMINYLLDMKMHGQDIKELDKTKVIWIFARFCSQLRFWREIQKYLNFRNLEFLRWTDKTTLFAKWSLIICVTLWMHRVTCIPWATTGRSGCWEFINKQLTFFLVCRSLFIILLFDVFTTYCAALFEKAIKNESSGETG